MLCQSLNAEFGPKGIHVAHIIIDGAVDAPDTLGKMLGPEKFKSCEKPAVWSMTGLMLPTKIATPIIICINSIGPLGAMR
jgi:hypothetical protein